MKFSMRAAIAILFLMLILLFGMFFWPFILKNIIEPISLVTWILLRIFVLSIDQKYYWGAIIFIIILLLARLLLPRDQLTIEAKNSPDSNATIKNIGYWRIIFTRTGHDVSDEETLRRELIHLLLSLYASKQRISTNYILYEALQTGEIPLPQHIYTFLFPDQPKKSKWSLGKLMQSIQAASQKWIRRWTGRETAEHYRMIDEVLSFMETTMEMKNDDGKYLPNKY